MTRGKRQADPEFTATAINPTEQIVQALERLMPDAGSLFKGPIFNGQSEVELFLEQFEDVTAANKGTDREALLDLRIRLQGPSQTYRGGSTRHEVMDSLSARYGTSQRQVKERLVKFK